MLQGDRDRTIQAGRAGSRTTLPPRSANPVLALQRSVGNRGTTRLLARKAVAGHGTFEHSVQIGKLGPIEVTQSNVDEWVGKKSQPDEIVVTSVKGKHSAELKHLSDSKNRVETVQFSTITGQNSWAIVTIKHGIIKGYAADPSGTTEQWTLTGFDGVDIKRTSIGTPRP